MVYSTPVRNQSQLIRNSGFSTSNQNSSNKETTTWDWPISTRFRRPCELLVKCEFLLRGSKSFGSSEPKETNACNKWPVYQHPSSFVNSSRHMYPLGTYFFKTFYWCAFERYVFALFYQIIIVGERDAEDTKQLLRCVHSHYIPHKVLMLCDGKADGFLASKLNVFKTLERKDNRATAYVCENYTCHLPVNSVEELQKILSSASNWTTSILTLK